MLSSLKNKAPNYQHKISNELNFYKDCHEVHALPDIFHYWSNKYLLPKQQPHGFNSPDDFFVKKTLEQINQADLNQCFNILSVGCGNGESEIQLAQQITSQGHSNFKIICLDINPSMLERCNQAAKKMKLENHIVTLCADFNLWTTDLSFDVIIANQCLHHVLALEHLFDTIHQALTENGVFLVSDMIGRNGHMRWPEALDLLNDVWQQLPDRIKHNRLLNRFEKNYINHDCSTSGFEGIRAQDVLPLLVERFHFNLFIPFANIIMVLIDRPFGHNFDINKPQDLARIDETHLLDEQAILDGLIKPTQMIAVLSKGSGMSVLTHEKLTPEFCIRPY